MLETPFGWLLCGLFLSALWVAWRQNKRFIAVLRQEESNDESARRAAIPAQLEAQDTPHLLASLYEDACRADGFLATAQGTDTWAQLSSAAKSSHQRRLQSDLEQADRFLLSIHHQLRLLLSRGAIARDLLREEEMMLARVPFEPLAVLLVGKPEERVSHVVGHVRAALDSLRQRIREEQHPRVP